MSYERIYPCISDSCQGLLNASRYALAEAYIVGMKSWISIHTGAIGSTIVAAMASCMAQHEISEAIETTVCVFQSLLFRSQNLLRLSRIISVMLIRTRLTGCQSNARTQSQRNT